MDYQLKTLALRCGLSLSQYWHLRLVLAVSLGPLLACLYLAVWGKRPRHSLWVGRDGRLVARPDRQAPGPT